MSNRVHNFSAGPAALPLEVLKKAQASLCNYAGSGMSVMEMSHRSPEFTAIIEGTEALIRKLLNVPSNYSVLFLQGGASMQFFMIPLNLVTDNKGVDLIQTGSWTKKSMAEISKVTKVNVVASGEADNFTKLPNLSEVTFSKDAAYTHICSNNTIFGTQFKSFPTMPSNVPLIADMSSDILSRKINVEDFGIIFAGAQKNLGPSGVTLVIIRNDLAERASDSIATMLQYRTHIKAKSLYNTPPTFGIYIMKLVLEYIEAQGGLPSIEERNKTKATKLYDAIDNTEYYHGPIAKEDRSSMNVVFRIKAAFDNPEKTQLEDKFVAEAKLAGLTNIKGHRSVGGLRASIYNAVPEASVDALIDFMQQFAKEN